MNPSLLLAIFFLAIAVIGCGLVIWLFVLLLVVRAPFVKSPDDLVDTLIDQLAISSRDTVYDLGCGDASLLIQIAKKTGAKTVGYEISPLAFVAASRAVKERGVQTQLHFRSFFNADISDATVIFIFLIGSVMPKVEGWLAKNANRGAHIVSYGFPLPHWKPETIIHAANPGGSNVYLYRR